MNMILKFLKINMILNVIKFYKNYRYIENEAAAFIKKMFLFIHFFKTIFEVS